VRINLGITSTHSTFLVCFLAKSYVTTATISLETVQDSGYILRHLVTLDKGQPEMVREVCIISEVGEAVVLYMEAEIDVSSTIIGRVEVKYDVERKLGQQASADLIEG
jgi:hypothetical protein